MPLGAVTGILGGLGGAVSALGGNSSARQVPFSKGVARQVNLASEALPVFREEANDALDLFDAETGRAINEINRLAPADTEVITGLLGRAQNFDGLDAFERIRDGNISALAGFTNRLSGLGSRADKVAQAQLGLGGRPNSSFGTQLRQSFLSSQAAPILNTIFANLGGQSAQVLNNDIANTNRVLGLIDARTQIPRRTLPLILDPVQARLNTLQGEAGLLQGLGAAAATNTAGFQSQPNTAARIGSALSSLGAIDGSNFGRLGQSLFSTPAIPQNNQTDAAGLIGLLQALGLGGTTSANTNPFIFGFPQVA